MTFGRDEDFVGGPGQGPLVEETGIHLVWLACMLNFTVFRGLATLRTSLTVDEQQAVASRSAEGLSIIAGDGCLVERATRPKGGGVRDFLYALVTGKDTVSRQQTAIANRVPLEVFLAAEVLEQALAESSHRRGGGPTTSFRGFALTHREAAHSSLGLSASRHLRRYDGRFGLVPSQRRAANSDDVIPFKEFDLRRVSPQNVLAFFSTDNINYTRVGADAGKVGHTMVQRSEVPKDHIDHNLNLLSPRISVAPRPPPADATVLVPRPSDFLMLARQRRGGLRHLLHFWADVCAGRVAVASTLPRPPRTEVVDDGLVVESEKAERWALRESGERRDVWSRNFITESDCVDQDQACNTSVKEIALMAKFCCGVEDSVRRCGELMQKEDRDEADEKDLRWLLLKSFAYIR
jgi:hypothetical protein